MQCDPYLTRKILKLPLIHRQMNALAVHYILEMLVNSLVGFRNFNNFAAQMTTHEDPQIQAILDYATLI